MTGPDTGPTEPTNAVAEQRDRELLAAASRQSPIALVFIALAFVRRIGVVNIAIAVAFAFSGRLSLVVGAVAAVIATAVLVGSALSWWRFTFCVADDELVVTKGVLTVERLVIPLGRVQSVGIEQRLLHRIVGLVAASVDTAGSDGAEFTIDAVDRVRAEALQRLATGSDAFRDEEATANDGRGVDGSSGTGTPPGPGESGDVMIRRTPRELVLVGLTAVPWAGLVAIVPLIAFGDEIAGLMGFDVSAESAAADTVSGLSPAAAILGGLALLVAATLVGLILQVARSLFEDWDLTLIRTSVGVRRTAGLANRTSTASTLRRIQAVTTHRSPLQRRVGIRRVTLATIGAGDLVIPGSDDDELALLRTVAFGTGSSTPLDRRVSHWIVFVEVRKVAAAALVLGVAAAFAFGWWAVSVIAAVPIAWAAAERSWRRRRWGFGLERLAERRQLVAESTTEIDVAKAQSVVLERSFFERRRNLASVRLVTASGAVTIPMIDAVEAEDLRDRLLRVVESSGRPGM